MLLTDQIAIALLAFVAGYVGLVAIVTLQSWRKRRGWTGAGSQPAG